MMNLNQIPANMMKIRCLQRAQYVTLKPIRAIIPSAQLVPIQQNRSIAVQKRSCQLNRPFPNWKSHEKVFAKLNLNGNLEKCFSSAASDEKLEKEEESHDLPKEASEKAKGEGVEHEFLAETRQLLDIVASSLYSEKEVFIRELISNASDAIEKMRYIQITGEMHLSNAEREPLIAIETDKIANTITIRDNGIGMTAGEMVENLGTIAKSGSKEFIKEMVSKSSAQEGVSYYKYIN